MDVQSYVQVFKCASYVFAFVCFRNIHSAPTHDTAPYPLSALRTGALAYARRQYKGSSMPFPGLALALGAAAEAIKILIRGRAALLSPKGCL